MVFSSIEFMFYFLPAVLVGYYLLKRWRGAANLFLTVMSLGFYAFGAPKFFPIMLGSIVANWVFGLWVDKVRDNKKKAKLVIALMAVFNLGLLGVYKYLTFLLSSLNLWFTINLPVPKIMLPIGISFFTFQAMSYVIDVYREHGKVQKNLLNVCLYISFFPQLIAGPIVRYQTVADEIMDRRENLDDFIFGVQRFMRGVCKKMLIANNLGLLVDTAFALESSQLSVISAWVAACAYLMQVYFDFSGYSDMAIGLGRMFGFHFLENFNFPFICKSVGEFWKRWHISLGSWFTDYLYIPLGGSRVKLPRLIFNMMVVWTLTGLWHGAAWTYFLWGMMFGVFLVIERLTGLGKWMSKRPIGHFYAMFIVVTITVMIRSDNLGVAWTFYGSMFGLNGASLWNSLTGVFLREYGAFLLAGVVLSLPVPDFMRQKLHVPESFMQIAGGIALAVLTVVAITYIAVGSYNPFIYFNF
ncbi:MAG: MBOAT family protein [Clostridia bacterium]|nr:MBOAT family protein [Clostridia bacterium]